MSRPSKTTRRELVYAGMASHDGEVVHAYFMVSDRGDLEDKAQIYPAPLGNFPPGAVCSYQVGPDGAIHPQTAIFERTWPDQKKVAEWTVRSGCTAASEAAWASKELPRAFACLDPVREAYRTLQDEELRGVLLAQMVRYVVSTDDE